MATLKELLSKTTNAKMGYASDCDLGLFGQNHCEFDDYYEDDDEDYNEDDGYPY